MERNKLGMTRMAELDQSVTTVAVIGAGQVGQTHGQVFAGLGPTVRVVGIADTDEERAAELATVVGSPHFTDYRQLLELAPDIAVIALPHHLHRVAALTAAEAGSHVLMEKPLAATLVDAQAIIDSCRRHKVLLTISFVHRYRTEFQQAHRLITQGQLGKVTMIVDNFGLPGGPHVPDWVWQDHRLGGGILMYSGIHSIDWQCWLVDSEVEEVFAQTIPQSQGSDAENGLVVTLRFANGCLGTLIGHQPGYPVTPRIRSTQIYGSSACLTIRSGDYLDFSGHTQAYRLNVTRDDPFVTQAQEFVTVVRAKQEPWISGQDGMRALAVIMAIYRSAQSGQPILLT